MDGEVEIEVHHESRPDEDSSIRRALDAYNETAGPFADICPLRCFARDSAGDLLGGAVGHTWGTSCELGQIFVHEAYRRRGLGSELLRRFEAEAQARGASLIYLDTFSFHAPEFYAAHGYEVSCKFGGLPQGAVLYILHKSLAAA